MFDMARCNAPTMLNMGYQEPLPFVEAAKQLQCFPKLPDLEITPIPVHPTSNTYTKHLEDVMQRSVAQCEKKVAIKTTKEQKNMAKLLKQLPILDKYFDLYQKIGEGTYSTVYLASYKTAKSSRQYAIKHLTDNVSFSKIQKELRYMQIIGGRDNVVNVLNCFKNDNKDCVVFVMPYLSHKRFSDYVLNMDVNELRFYMKNLFVALRRVHSFNVIHRDVKPGNFLYNRSTKEFLLVDFGLAQDVDETQKERNANVEGDGENVPINYSKRKRSSTDDGNPVHKVAVMTPLQSRENIMSPTKNQNISSPNSPAFQSSENRRKFTFDKTRFLSKSSTSSCNSPKLFTFESPNASSAKSHTSTRRETSLGTSLLKSQTESKIASTPKDLSSANEIQKTFTPLVANKVLNGSFVQVRNSKVVARDQAECACSGTAAICTPCAAKRTLAAPRAGTPGFRPPEVLLKYLHQTTAVDMWAAGVILLCVLSGCYPFFKSPSDLAALIEIISIFGTNAVASVADQFGRRMTSSEFRAPLDLKKMCRRLRARRTNQGLPPSTGFCNRCHQNIRAYECVCKIEDEDYSTSNHFTNGDIYPESAYHLLSRLLDLNPVTRLTATQALEHPFITQI